MPAAVGVVRARQKLLNIPQNVTQRFVNPRFMIYTLKYPPDVLKTNQFSAGALGNGVPGSPRPSALPFTSPRQGTSFTGIERRLR
jgi:hypothetical protein